MLQHAPPVERILAEAHHLVLGLEAVQRRDGPEGLLVRAEHLGVAAAQHGGLEEQRPRAVRPAAQQHRRAL